jgi:hypothetical protein
MRGYILFFCVLLLFVAYTRATQAEGFQDGETAPRPFALLLRGEAFRKGGQGTRAIGAEDAYDEQMAASKTHMDLVRAIEARGFSVEVFIDTYSTQYDNQLKAAYGAHLKDARFHKTRLGTQTMLLKDGVEMVSGSPTLLILRLDMYLKPEFMELYDPSAPTIQFFSICAHGWHKTPKGNPRINDTVFHFPSKDIGRTAMLYSDLNLIGWHDLLDNEPLKYGTDYSLMTTRYYDSDSGKDWNPYYRIVGRQESTEWRSEGKEFPGDG